MKGGNNQLLQRRLKVISMAGGRKYFVASCIIVELVELCAAACVVCWRKCMLIGMKYLLRDGGACGGGSGGEKGIENIPALCSPASLMPENIDKGGGLKRA